MVELARSELILGGQKSGKSRRAELLARDGRYALLWRLGATTADDVDDVDDAVDPAVGTGADDATSHPDGLARTG